MRTVSIEQLKPKVSKSKQLQKPKVQATPPPPPAPAPKVEVAAPVINVDMSQFSKDNAAALKALVDAILAQQPATAAPAEWLFEVQRDGNNFIKSFTAKAT